MFSTYKFKRWKFQIYTEGGHYYGKHGKCGLNFGKLYLYVNFYFYYNKKNINLKFPRSIYNETINFLRQQNGLVFKVPSSIP